MQLVVRTINKYEGTDVVRKATTTSRGDVIEVVGDDHQWGRLDLTNPSWVVLKVPISMTEALAMKRGADSEGFDTTSYRIREFYLDLDKLISLGYRGIPTKKEAEEVRNRYEAQGGSRNEAKHHPSNALATEIVEISVEDFRSVRARKPSLDDRFIIG